MKDDKEIIKEFEKIAYPIVHSNTFPEKDDVCLERLEKFILWKIRQVREEGFKAGQEELKQIIIEDVPHKYQKRLLKLANKI